VITQERMREDLRRWGSNLDTLRTSDEYVLAAWEAGNDARRLGGNRGDVQHEMARAVSRLDRDWTDA
jgi:hypothetical protein